MQARRLEFLDGGACGLAGAIWRIRAEVSFLRETSRAFFGRDREGWTR